MKTARRRDQVRDWPRARSLCISLLAWIAELRFPDSFSLSLFVLPPKSFGRLGFRFGAVSTSSVGSQALLPVPTRSHVAYRTGSSYHFFISSCFYSFFSYSAPPYSSLIFFGRRCSLGCIVPCTLGSLFPSSLFLSNVVAWILMAQLARTAAAFSLYSVSLIIQCVTGRHLLAALSVALRHR